jgi:hypothetical protein
LYDDKGSAEGMALLVREARFKVLATRIVAFKGLNPNPVPAGEGEAGRGKRWLGVYHVYFSITKQAWHQSVQQTSSLKKAIAGG